MNAATPKSPEKVKEVKKEEPEEAEDEPYIYEIVEEEEEKPKAAPVKEEKPVVLKEDALTPTKEAPSTVEEKAEEQKDVATILDVDMDDGLTTMIPPDFAEDLTMQREALRRAMKDFLDDELGWQDVLGGSGEPADAIAETPREFRRGSAVSHFRQSTWGKQWLQWRSEHQQTSPPSSPTKPDGEAPAKTSGAAAQPDSARVAGLASSQTGGGDNDRTAVGVSEQANASATAALAAHEIRLPASVDSNLSAT